MKKLLITAVMAVGFFFAAQTANAQDYRYERECRWQRNYYGRLVYVCQNRRVYRNYGDYRSRQVRRDYNRGHRCFGRYNDRRCYRPERRNGLRIYIPLHIRF
jgi:hypothetical protein